MEVLDLKENFLLKTQSVLVYTSIVVAVLTFVLGLGFMTNYYSLFFDGTFDMYTYYKEVQTLNREIFYAAVTFIVLAFLLISFDINKKAPRLFGMLFVVGSTVYTFIKSISVLNNIPYYLDKYRAFDFTEMKKYTPSTFAFDIAKLLFQFWIILTVALFAICIINYISTIKNKKLRSGLNES